jgi:CRP-like cAMP-binding protein
MIQFFKSLQLLSDNDLQKMDGLPISKTLKKGMFLIQEGKICNEIAFIKSGILRSFYINNEGEEITNCITFENELMSAFSSFITQKPTEENIQAVVDTELLILKRSDMELLYENSSAWQKVGRYLTEMQYVELEQRTVSFQKNSAKQRYEKLIEHHSNYIKYIPLQYLASYLGITPRHLSRLRKENFIIGHLSISLLFIRNTFASSFIKQII